MKKYILIAITSISLFACNQKATQNDLTAFNKNLVVAKQFIDVFTTKDSTKEASLLADNFTFDATEIGKDSLSKEDLLKGDREIMRTFNDIKLENADYYPGVDSSYKISSEVRVYGTWVSKFASTGKISRMKYYAIFKFNDAGLITNLEERCNLADMSKQLDN
ncbi:MAG: nuclear transport factor 2 family protein [Sediminibacterium sp.]|nr:MAG: nuclear transport factor 2 family protein [Sediminibacterium sp.]